MVYDSAVDINNDKNLKVIRKEVANENGVLIFDPDFFRGDQQFFRGADNRLSEQ